MIYVMTIHTNLTNFGIGNDRALQDEQDAIEDVINDALPGHFDDVMVHNVCHPFDFNQPQQDSDPAEAQGDDDPFQDVVGQTGEQAFHEG
jgi:hypothetical protein